MPKISRGGRRGREARRKDRTVAANIEEESRRAQHALTFTQEYRRWRLRRILGGVLIALGVVVVFTHVFVHLGNIQWLPTQGLQDLLTGYPAGGLLIVLGFVVLGRQ